MSETDRLDGEYRSLPVPDGLDGMRLDQAIARLFGLSRTAAAALVEAGEVVVDGDARPKSDRVSAGSWLEVTLPAAPLPSAAVAERSHSAEFNHNAGVPWRSHFVERSKGW